ncbi:helix-turn-helix domain-containing protein [Actinocorallia sp. API 0066]|uniref:helix-turn-helix domain-containing protein n=1 Tax=Actinocorallia sp. API 0066 TaxID=2896846 RepID=UPI001E372428|nr:helix-turn-helix transcriptional regulator [Actinocorallia sp. API 0066]MCD0452828.1 helix-turn-helix domain-containing protein [Actinocorallia sp. API 0066]
MPDSNTSIGGRVKELRRRHALSQEALADAAKVSVAVVRKIEQGGTARMETYHALARVLGVRTVWFANPATPAPAEAAHDELLLADIRSAIIPPVDITGRPMRLGYDTVDADTADLRRLRTATDRAALAYHHDRYDDLASIIPALVRSAHHHVEHFDGDEEAEARRIRADILSIGGRYLIQVREHDLALAALRASLEDAVAVGDMPLAASAVASQAWAMMRQGRLTEVETLCVTTAEQIEPKVSGASVVDLSAWGWLLIRAAAAAARNNRPDAAREYAQIAHTAGARVGAQRQNVLSYSTFGPIDTMYSAVEVEMTAHEPARALGLAKTRPRGVGSTDPNTASRHRLTIADAQIQVGDPDRATDILMTLKAKHPEWLRQQQAGRDVVRKLLASRARTLSGPQRELADFMDVEG